MEINAIIRFVTLSVDAVHQAALCEQQRQRQHQHTQRLPGNIQLPNTCKAPDERTAK